MTATQIQTRNALRTELETTTDLHVANQCLNELDKLRHELEFQQAPVFQQSEMKDLFAKYYIKFFGE